MCICRTYNKLAINNSFRLKSIYLHYVSISLNVFTIGHMQGSNNIQTVKATVLNAGSAAAIVTFLYWWIHTSSFLPAYTSFPKPVFLLCKAKIYAFLTLSSYEKQVHFKRPLSFLHLLPVTPLLGRVDMSSCAAEQSYRTG